MIVAVININKVAHPAIVKYSVVKIAANTGGKKSEGNLNQPLLVSAEKKTSKNHYQRNTRNHHQPVRMPGEQSKSGTVICCHYQSQETVYN